MPAKATPLGAHSEAITIETEKVTPHFQLGRPVSRLPVDLRLINFTYVCVGFHHRLYIYIYVDIDMYAKNTDMFPVCFCIIFVVCQAKTWWNGETKQATETAKHVLNQEQ